MQTFTYPCITPCYHRGILWNPGDVYATEDPTDIPPHHFEGGINPKDTESVQALINEHLGTPNDDESEDDDGFGPLPHQDIPARKRTQEQKDEIKAERARRKALKAQE